MKNFKAILLLMLLQLFILQCHPKEEKTVTQKIHPCASDVSMLDDEILALKSPFADELLKDVKVPEDRVCRLVNFLLEEAKSRNQSSKRDRINALTNLFENRAKNLTTKSIDFPKDYPEILKVGTGESITIDLWLTPTCSKCAQFILKDFTAFYESLIKNPMHYEVKVRVFPYMVLSDTLALDALKSPQVIADQEMSVLLYHHMENGHQITVDQLKKWYEIVYKPSLDEDYKKNPTQSFMKVLSLTAVKDKALGTSKENLTKILSKLTPEERNSSSFLFVNGKRWSNFQQFKLNQAHLIDFMISQKDY